MGINRGNNNLDFAIVIALLLILAGLFLYLGCDAMKRKLRIYYERGAHAVALHRKYRGTYGSRAYRDAAFKWGDPQDEEDLNKIYRYMFENDKNAWLMTDAGGEWSDPNDDEALE